MRAEGEGHKTNIDKTRLVGIGLMLSGVLAFTFAFVGVPGAGATSATPLHHPVSCEQTTGAYTPIGQVLQAVVNSGCNTTTTHGKCGCSTTTTTTGPTTTSSSTTTTTGPTTTSSSTTSTSTSTTTSTTIGPGLVVRGSTTTTTPVSNNLVTTTTLHKTIVVEGTTAGLAPPQIAVSPTSGVLPFTGSPTAPLAGLGVVLVLTGAGLSRRKRRLAD